MADTITDNREEQGSEGVGATGGPVRMERERSTVEQMIRLYCKGNHGVKREGGLCQKCNELLNYSNERLDRCPYGENKPTCLKCRTHCYEPEMREKIRMVMRYSGPRMLLRHPILTLGHIIDGMMKKT